MLQGLEGQGVALRRRFGRVAHGHGGSSRRERGRVSGEEGADVRVRSQPHVDDVEAAVGDTRRLKLVGHAGGRLIQVTDLVRSGQPVGLRLPDACGDEGRGQQIVAFRVPGGHEALVTEPQVDGATHLFGLGGDERREGLRQRHPPGTACQRQVGDSPLRHRRGQDPHGVLAGPARGVAQCGKHDDLWRGGGRSRLLDLGDGLGAGGTGVSH